MVMVLNFQPYILEILSYFGLCLTYKTEISFERKLVRRIFRKIKTWFFSLLLISFFVKNS